MPSYNTDIYTDRKLKFTAGCGSNDMVADETHFINYNPTYCSQLNGLDANGHYKNCLVHPRSYIRNNNTFPYVYQSSLGLQFNYVEKQQIWQHQNYYTFGAITPSTAGVFIYNHPQFYKYRENGGSLSLCDDAAHVVLGGGWHIPSAAEVQDLYTNGLLVFKGSNGSGLFYSGEGRGVDYDFGCVMEGGYLNDKGVGDDTSVWFWTRDTELHNGQYYPVVANIDVINNDLTFYDVGYHNLFDSLNFAFPILPVINGCPAMWNIAYFTRKS